ncbi:chromosome partitioning protein ParA [Ruegeria marisrubri]|uniref:Chromosome partitioning protein ParA n=1 Tax=Ruegeria marisrubri TaxID=1685379 RepID=A0A0X3UD90_9RHOB|nr:DUF4041 domain-containing protein [Ruegeria marisrubri]KUJ85191.1 chromosome partitioning protein ParA [Ruegeria marisrubri]
MTGSPLADVIVVLLTVSPVLAIVFLVLWLKRRRDLKALEFETDKRDAELTRQIQAAENSKHQLEERFSAILDIEAEVQKTRTERDRIEREIESLRATYKEKRQIYDRLLEQVAIFDEQISFAEFGVYQPHFEFGDSERYKEAIKAVRDEQKNVVKAKTAVDVHTAWTVEGSKAKGQTMANRAVRLALRAFNAEADAAIANTRWNNAEAMIRRIENACTQINKANASLNIEITQYYLDLKLRELRLTHEYREQLKAERDERAEEARLQREEKRLEVEAEEARREEEKYEAMLAKARAEAGAIQSEDQGAKIAELERQLAEAHEKTERAQAMAERTKTGFVYIISNVGSFGEDVVKIGLTRRLDPADRVRELGDASVPFLFDTHAMIYSEEAPALEAALHAEFDGQRVNGANMRKEFFRATLEEVEAAVRFLAPDAEFHKDVEAQEFRETLAKRKQQLEAERQDEKLMFPAEI